MNKIENGIKLDFNNVLIRPKRSTYNSRNEINLERKFKFKHSPIIWEGIPIIAANMDTIGTFEVYEALKEFKIVTALHKFYTAEQIINYNNNNNNNNNVMDPNYYMISTGIKDSDIERLKQIFNSVDCNWICIDIANGYIQNLINFCKKIRELFPQKIIVAGNVVTREIVEELILNGKVDVVKVGIGPGSVCTTRLKTGVGMPQLSAIIECADAAHGVDGQIIADGGITCPGDMAKAFGAGADFVMGGSLFAGHDENAGELIEENNEKYKIFYGMSSQQAMEKHYGKMDNYRSSEGRYLKIKYKGPINNTVLDYLGGLRSTCTYINAGSIEQLPKCCTFIQVNQQVNTSLL